MTAQFMRLMPRYSSSRHRCGRGAKKNATPAARAPGFKWKGGVERRREAPTVEQAERDPAKRNNKLFFFSVLLIYSSKCHSVHVNTIGLSYNPPKQITPPRWCLSLNFF
jgi:hypothetical protein